MNKQQIQQRVLQNGKPLGMDKFEWNEKAEVFSTNESDLLLDFNGRDSLTFKTGFNCVFYTGSGCTFDTGSSCAFKTGKKCVVVRRDVYEVIELKEDQKIRLKGSGCVGYYILTS